MKFIFLIVLLANISFFLWEYNSPRLYSTQSNKTQSKQNLKPIFLLNEVVIPTKNVEIPSTTHISELEAVKTDQLIISKDSKKIEIASQDKTSPTSLESNTANEQISTTIVFCYEIGPFQDKNLISQWIDLNKNTFSHFLQIEKNRPMKPRYLVYSPATGNVEQSKKNLALFQKMGVNDLWVFRKGELEGAISFGLFSKENRALNLQNSLSKKGLESKILHTKITRPQLYLQIFTENEKLKSIFNANNKPLIADCESD